MNAFGYHVQVVLNLLGILYFFFILLICQLFFNYSPDFQSISQITLKVIVFLGTYFFIKFQRNKSSILLGNFLFWEKVVFYSIYFCIVFVPVSILATVFLQVSRPESFNMISYSFIQLGYNLWIARISTIGVFVFSFYFTYTIYKNNQSWIDFKNTLRRNLASLSSPNLTPIFEVKNVYSFIMFEVFSSIGLIYFSNIIQVINMGIIKIILEWIEFTK